MAVWATGNYSSLWQELHARPYAPAYADASNDTAFLNAWSARVPAEGGCRCRDTWRIWFAANPAVFTSRDAYFAWTVRAHNAVNAKLGKPQYTLEQALQRYAPQAARAVPVSSAAAVVNEALDPAWYLDQYADLRRNGVHTHAQAIEHWHVHGLREQRAPNAAALARKQSS